MTKEREPSSGTDKTGIPIGKGEIFVLGFHGVRYQVKDVSRSIAFYTRHLGFKVGVLRNYSIWRGLTA